MNNKKTRANTFIPTDDASRKIMHERSVACATSFDHQDIVDTGIPYIRFRLGAGELYGVEFKSTKGIVQVTNMKKPPCVPPIICGVVNYQGKLIGVVDLAKILGVASSQSQIQPIQSIIIASFEIMTVGILVGEIEMSDTFKSNELSDSILSESDIKKGFIKGIDKGKISIINLDTILASIKMTEGAV